MPREKTANAPARAQNLTAQCLVCLGSAAPHTHYGAVCCYSCRAFFRRGIRRQYSCVRGDNGCAVNSITRTNCKACRYARCLVVGMKPSLVDASIGKKKGEQGAVVNEGVQDDMSLEAEAASQFIVPNIIAKNHNLHPQPRVVQEPAAVTAVVTNPEQQQFQLPSLVANSETSLLLQALEAGGVKKKEIGAAAADVDIPEPEPQQVEIADDQQIVLPPGAQTVRQQTYYIFHAGTQTFEPITIAEFLDQPVAEEVVVAEGVCQQEMITGEINKPELEDRSSIEEASPDLMGEEDGEQKETGGVQFDSRNEDHRIIQEYLRLQQERTGLQSKADPVEILETPPRMEEEDTAAAVGHMTAGNVVQQQVISYEEQQLEEEQIVYVDPPPQQVIYQEVVAPKVNIEDLVDLCFEEEFKKKPGKRSVAALRARNLRDQNLPRIAPKRGYSGGKGSPRDMNKHYRRPLLPRRQLEAPPTESPKRQKLANNNPPPSQHNPPPPAHQQQSSNTASRTPESARHNSSVAEILIASSPHNISISGPPKGQQQQQQPEQTQRATTPQLQGVVKLYKTGNPPPNHSETSDQVEDGASAMEPAMGPTVASQDSGQPTAVQTNRKVSVIVSKQAALNTNLNPRNLVVSPGKPVVSPGKPVVSPGKPAGKTAGGQIHVGISPTKVILAKVTASTVKSPGRSSPVKALASPVTGPVKLTTTSTVKVVASPVTTSAVKVVASPVKTPTCAVKEVMGSSPVKRGCDNVDESPSTSSSPLKKQKTKNKVIPFSGNLRLLKVPYLKFTLEEDFMIQEVLAGRDSLVNRYFGDLIDTAPELTIQGYRMLTSPAAQERGIAATDTNRVWLKMRSFFNSVLDERNCLIPRGMGRFSPGFMANTVKFSYDGFCALEMAVFLANHKAASSLYQQEFEGSCNYDQRIKDWISQNLPELRAAKPFGPENILTLMMVKGTREEEQFVTSTITEMMRVLEGDVKLQGLVSLLALISQPEGSPFFKNKNLKRLFNRLYTFLYRYLTKREEEEGTLPGRSSLDLAQIIPAAINKFHSVGAMQQHNLKQQLGLASNISSSPNNSPVVPTSQVQ